MKTKSIKNILLMIFILAVNNLSAVEKTYNLTTSSGDIFAYAENYENNLTATWNINIGMQKPIMFELNYEIENNYDFVKIYSIDNNNVETLIGVYSGFSEESIYVSTIIPTGKAKVVFTTDGSVSYENGIGFWGLESYYTIDNTYTNSNTNNQDMTVGGNAFVTGNLNVNGITSLNNNTTITGNVGIGSSALTDTKLRVFGNQITGTGSQTTFLSNNTLQIQQNANTETSMSFWQNGVAKALIGSKPNDSRLYFTNDNNGGGLGIANHSITLDINGKVGIGTTTPDSLLTVKGGIHARSVIIDLNGALVPDFVFDPTYNLMPLTQVEQFIKTNRHLPLIPSATEVQEKGMNMGEMQNKLLQKIEELTLYVIEQQKRIEQLEKNQK